MAVTLVVEDGTGRSDANALVSLTEAKTYWDGRGTSYSSYTDDQLNGAIVRASAFLTNAFVWQGLKVNGRDQVMPFPRHALLDRDNWPVSSTEVPREVVAACSEIALYEAANPEAMNPQVVLSEKVRSEQVGSIRVEYANIFNNATDARPVLTVVSDLLWPFLANGQGNVLSGTTNRV